MLEELNFACHTKDMIYPPDSQRFISRSKLFPDQERSPQEVNNGRQAMITKNEIEQEVAKLASQVNKHLHNSREMMGRFKPLLKKSGLQVEILGLKAWLAVLDQWIYRKKRREQATNQSPETKKGG